MPIDPDILVDRNGKEIRVGDIVGYHEPTSPFNGSCFSTSSYDYKWVCKVLDIWKAYTQWTILLSESHNASNVGDLYLTYNVPSDGYEWNLSDKEACWWTVLEDSSWWEIWRVR
ncbi:MAG: hypothetical protein ACXABY_03700 [Candidatus Thorarchaeota archaeon]|jgi:hypothetical protein